MAYCGPRGTPYHEFEAWPQFSRDAALAWRIWDSEFCSGCGTHPDEWIDPDDNGPIFPAPYRVEQVTCLGCKARAKDQRKKDEYNKQQEDAIRKATPQGQEPRYPLRVTWVRGVLRRWRAPLPDQHEQ